MLPPSLLRTDFGPAPSGRNLIDTESLLWLGLVPGMKTPEKPSLTPAAQLIPLEDSSVALVDQVLRRCGSWDYADVRAFLIQHLDACQALIAALPHIEGVFGKGTNVNLQVLVDHDGDGDVVLNALIQTPDSVDAAIEKRRTFNRRWWSSARKIVKHLNFDIDCV